MCCFSDKYMFLNKLDLSICFKLFIIVVKYIIILLCIWAMRSQFESYTRYS